MEWLHVLVAYLHLLIPLQFAICMYAALIGVLTARELLRHELRVQVYESVIL